MGHKPRYRPKYLAAKLLQVRRRLGASQSEMVQLLRFQTSNARISEYEKGTREPNLMVLLRYARIAGVSVDALIDDELKPSKLIIK
jgi:transcriptional regulator with XRE-family HTH domain